MIENITSSNVNYITASCYSRFLNPRYIIYAHGNPILGKINFSKVVSLQLATLHRKLNSLTDILKCFGCFRYFAFPFIYI